jgi:hypothetical protein
MRSLSKDLLQELQEELFWGTCGDRSEPQSLLARPSPTFIARSRDHQGRILAPGPWLISALSGAKSTGCRSPHFSQDRCLAPSPRRITTRDDNSVLSNRPLGIGQDSILMTESLTVVLSNLIAPRASASISQQLLKGHRTYVLGIAITSEWGGVPPAHQRVF